MRRTVQRTVTIDGIGLHSGRPVRIHVRPAIPGKGIVFRRSDMVPAREIAALWHNVEQTALCTRLVDPSGVSISTIEHLMAAFAALAVTDVIVDVDGPEIPIMDGSALPFVEAIGAAGMRVLPGRLQHLEVTRQVRVERGDAWASLSPSHDFTMTFEIDFPDAAIGKQSRFSRVDSRSFIDDLSDSRTFCRMSDVEMMRSRGLALGGTMTNAVVVEGDAVLSPGGLRHDDEPVRHKMLDAVGDLALAGYPLIAHYHGHKAGHSLTNELLRKLFVTPGAYRLVEESEQIAA